MRVGLKITVFLFIFSVFTEFKSQVILTNDIFYGGVTSDGFSPNNLETTGTLNVYIEPGSIIKKAFLLVSNTTRDSVKNNSIVFNGETIELKNNDFLLPFYTSTSSNAVILYKLRHLVIDVKDLVSPTQTSYLLKSPSNQDVTASDGVFSNFYLYIEYENSALPKINSLVVLNSYNAQWLLSYNIMNLNPMNLTQNVGFTFNSHSICDIFEDGSYIKINSSNIGLVGGEEAPGIEPYCTGVRGAFYYQNSTLYGLGNDTPDPFMNGVDALASIENYITDPSQVNIQFEYQGGPTDNSRRTNPIHQLFLTYTTPCDTFSVSTPKDTTLCYGETLQLNVTGGQSYEWSPGTGLSCVDCPNPVFTADSSMFYSIRIWNNDSCSVVRPLKINVRPEPKINAVSINPTECGTANGSVSFNGPSAQTYSLNGGAFQASNSFTNLGEGNYTLQFEDANGCLSADSTVYLGEVNNTVASFSLSPQTGATPLQVSINNTSQNASVYEWSLNGLGQSASFSSFLCDTAGIYTVQLIAWAYDPSCADTVEHTVYAYDSLIVPTAFTPNADGLHDTWELRHIDTSYPQNTVQIFNRWGKLVYESSAGTYESHPFDGVVDGEYPTESLYFIIRLNEQEELKGSLTIMRE